MKYSGTKIIMLLLLMVPAAICWAETPVIKKVPTTKETPTIKEATPIKRAPITRETSAIEKTPAIRETPAIKKIPVPVQQKTIIPKETETFKDNKEALGKLFFTSPKARGPPGSRSGIRDPVVG